MSVTLERELISAYLAGAGQELQALLARNDKEARTFLRTRRRTRHRGSRE